MKLKLYNMEADLHITDNQYLVCLALFFISYAIFEVRRPEVRLIERALIRIHRFLQTYS